MQTKDPYKNQLIIALIESVDVCECARVRMCVGQTTVTAEYFIHGCAYDWSACVACIRI